MPSELTNQPTISNFRIHPRTRCLSFVNLDTSICTGHPAYSDIMVHCHIHNLHLPASNLRCYCRYYRIGSRAHGNQTKLNVRTVCRCIRTKVMQKPSGNDPSFPSSLGFHDSVVWKHRFSTPLTWLFIYQQLFVSFQHHRHPECTHMLRTRFPGFCSLLPELCCYWSCHATSTTTNPITQTTRLCIVVCPAAGGREIKMRTDQQTGGNGSLREDGRKGNGKPPAGSVSSQSEDRSSTKTSLSVVVLLCGGEHTPPDFSGFDALH